MPKIPAPNDFEAAKLHLDRFWTEVFWRRENEQKVTIWSVGFFGFLLTLTYGASIDLCFLQKLALAAFPCLLGAGTSWYLRENRRKSRDIARLIVKLNDSLGAWEPGYLIADDALYPERWKRWGVAGSSKVSFAYQILVMAAALLSSAGIMLK